LKLYFILILYFLISLPTISIVLGIKITSDKDFRSTEKRSRAEFKPTKISRTLPSLKKFFDDRYLYRTLLRKLLVTLKQASWSGTINGNKIFRGEDGYLFLGNDYNNAIDGFRGIHTNDSDRTLELLKQIDTLAKKLDIVFRLIVAPNKHTFFPHKIPDFYEPLSETYLHRLRQTNAHRYGFIDILREFEDLPNEIQKYLYPKTDSHWTKLGAQYTQCALLNSLDIDCIPPSEFEIVPHRGFELARIAGINLTKNIDFATKFSLKQKPSDFSLSVLDIESDKPIEQKSSVLRLGKKFSQVTNHSLKNERFAVIARDSFADAWLRMGLVHNFQSTIVTHWFFLGDDKLNKKIIKNNSNIFIFEIVERSLTHINSKLETILDLFRSIQNQKN